MFNWFKFYLSCVLLGILREDHRVFQMNTAISEYDIKNGFHKRLGLKNYRKTSEKIFNHATKYYHEKNLAACFFVFNLC